MAEVKVCVIGAGLSGLCAAKHLIQKGITNVTVFEQSSKIGGVWQYDANPSHPNALYRNLTTNLPHTLMQYPDLPYPNQDSIALYPHHSVVMDYINYYADYFNLHSFIKLNHKITKLLPPNLLSFEMTQKSNNESLPKWTVEIEDIVHSQIIQEKFHSVIVCNGHYNVPYFPPFIGLEHFKKPMIHSQSYREPDHQMFDDKTIVVIGYRSSGVDIALEIFFECHQVTIYQVTHNKNVCKETQSKYRYFVDDDRFIYKQNITEFGRDSCVIFDDGTVIYPDLVLFCTGYSYDFQPFLNNESLVDLTFGQTVDGLYQQMVYPRIPSLFFVGLGLQIVPAVIAHYQCQWISHILADLRYNADRKCFESQCLPTMEKMYCWIKDNNQMSGEKGQFVLGLKQFDYCKELCLLAGVDIPSRLEVMHQMYANKCKPSPYLNAKL